MIRVIGGIYKGKRLKKVPSPEVRPMPDKLKESFFGIIKEDLPGCVFLDGFAGTGQIGIEALSCGAKSVVFIDELYPAMKTVKMNLERCRVGEGFQLIRKEFNRAVIQLSRQKLDFDIIFLDPPYRLLEERNPLKVIKKREILKDGGKIILRHHFKTRFEAKYYDLDRQVTIGDDTLSFYSYKAGQS